MTSCNIKYINQIKSQLEDAKSWASIRDVNLTVRGKDNNIRLEAKSSDRGHSKAKGLLQELIRSINTQFSITGDLVEKVSPISGGYATNVKFTQKALDELEEIAQRNVGEDVKKDSEITSKQLEILFPETKSINNSSNVTINNVQYQLPDGREIEEFIASEKTIRDLAARMSDRIGISVRFESDRSKNYKGKLENNTAVVNLAYATLDTPIHEILGHPIIRAIKSKRNVTKRQQWNFNKRFFDDQTTKDNTGKTITHQGHVYEVYELKKFSNVTYKAINFKRNEEIELSEKEFNDIVNESQLYTNLLKELEYGKGKEVLDRIKRDYVKKEQPYIRRFENPYEKNKFGTNITYFIDELNLSFATEEEAEKHLKDNEQYYTLEEQQEEAIVELMSLMVAEKLNKITDKNLISLLKQLLKQINDFIKSLLNTKELNINDIEADNTKFLIENKLKELIKNGTIKKEC